MDVLADVARGLRVTLGDLLGEPVLMEDEDKNDDVPAIRDALMAPRRLSRTLFSSAMSPEYIDPAPVAQLVEGAWSSYQKGDLGPARPLAGVDDAGQLPGAEDGRPVYGEGPGRALG